MPPFRGSRKHILDWVQQPKFKAELTALLQPTGAVVGEDSPVMPRSVAEPREARLERFGPTALGDVVDWRVLSRWWLAHSKGANTPNWDLASLCRTDAGVGLVLVEAKANAAELKVSGKGWNKHASSRSRRNHKHIGAAIREAGSHLEQLVPGVRISRDSHYQLSNRVAFCWKLATLGLPAVLVYLGFLGDDGIADAGEPFHDDAHWRRVLISHAAPVVPAGFFERRLDVGRAPMWALIRSRPVLQQSPPSASGADRTAPGGVSREG